jgi:hypothetical protein
VVAAPNGSFRKCGGCRFHPRRGKIPRPPEENEKEGPWRPSLSFSLMVATINVVFSRRFALSQRYPLELPQSINDDEWQEFMKDYDTVVVDAYKAAAYARLAGTVSYVVLLWMVAHIVYSQHIFDRYGWFVILLLANLGCLACDVTKHHKEVVEKLSEFCLSYSRKWEGKRLVVQLRMSHAGTVGRGGFHIDIIHSTDAATIHNDVESPESLDGVLADTPIATPVVEIEVTALIPTLTS